MSRLALLFGVCVVAACESTLPLPPPPAGQQPPLVTTMTPALGFAGTRVEIRGQHLTGARVRFGTAAPVDAVVSTRERLVVVVPEEAGTSGTALEVAVTTAFGSATAPGSFAYRGAGHLRSGRLAAEIDLRAELTEALWLPKDKTFFVASANYGRGVVTGEANPCEKGDLPRTVVGASSPVLIAEDQFAVIEELAVGQLSLRLCGKRIERVALGDFGSSARHIRRLAVDASGGVLAVQRPDATGVVLVDLATRPATLVRVGRPAPEDFVYGIAPYQNDGFLVGTLHGLRRLRFDEGTWAYSAPHAADAAFLHVLDAVPGCALVSDDLPRVYSLATWPPTLASTLGREVGTFVLSPDCERVGMATDRSLLAWDVTRPQAVLVGGTQVEKAGTPSRGPDATFLVPSKGQVVVVAARSGGLVETRPIKQFTSAPALRRADVTLDDGSVVRRPVIEIASGLFDVLVRLDERTLALRETSFLALPNHPRVGIGLTTGGGDVLIASHHPSDFEDTLRADFLSAGPGGERLAALETSGFLLRGDDTGLGFPLLPTLDEDFTSTRVRLLDPARAAARQPFVEHTFPAVIEHLAWLDDDTVAVATEADLRLFAGAAFREGRLEVLATYPLPGRLNSIARGPEGLVATMGDTVLWFSSSGVRSVRVPAVDTVGWVAMKLFRGARRAALIESRFSAPGVLRAWAIGDGALTSDPLQVTLPPEADWTASADGERLYVTTAGGERLLVYE